MKPSYYFIKYSFLITIMVLVAVICFASGGRWHRMFTYLLFVLALSVFLTMFGLGTRRAREFILSLYGKYAKKIDFVDISKDLLPGERIIIPLTPVFIAEFGLLSAHGSIVNILITNKRIVRFPKVFNTIWVPDAERDMRAGDIVTTAVNEVTGSNRELLAIHIVRKCSPYVILKTCKFGLPNYTHVYHEKAEEIYQALFPSVLRKGIGSCE